jgi:hypothetical protein
MKFKVLFMSSWFVVTLLGCGVIQQAGGPKYYTVSVSSDGPITVYNLNRHGIFFYSDSMSTISTALMAEAGDLLYISTDELDCYYRYNPKDGRQLSFTRDPDAPFKTFLNDRLISLYIDDDPAVWKWIEECDARSLRDLRSLHFAIEEKVPDLALLQKIARSKDGDLEVDESLLPRLNKLEFLFLSSAEDIKFVEDLPNLETLILSEGENLHDVKFDKMTKLRSLTLVACAISSLPALGNNKRLRNLYLVFDEEIEDINPIADLPRLQGVGFTYCDGVADISALDNLSRIKWISFPPGITQEDFSAFLSKYPGLEVVDLLGCHAISDISPLSGMASLRALNLFSESVEDLSPLYQLKDLELLTLYDNLYEEWQYEELREALPNTQIAIGGLCLGSGWLLLAIPMIVVSTACARFFRKRVVR